jgi:diaminopimelate decarboxylase
MEMISGFMIHNNCENGDFALFDRMLGDIEQKFGPLLKKAEWVSLGGGIHFTGRITRSSSSPSGSSASPASIGVQVYLEPGEASITKSTTLEVTVLDTLYNGKEPGHRRLLHRGAHARPADLPRDRQDRTLTRAPPHHGLRQVLPGGRYLRRVRLSPRS